MFGTVVHGPGMLRYFSFSITQLEDVTCTFDGEDKLVALEPAILTRLQSKAVDDSLNKFEKSTFAALNSFLGRHGTTVTPFCAGAASRLCQYLPMERTSDSNKQRTIIGELKFLKTVLCFG